MRINMSYCRMENTYLALREAFDNGEGEYGNEYNEDGREEMVLSPLSESEQEYRRRLVNLCREIVDNFGDDE